MIVISFVALIVLSVANVSTSKEIINTPALCEPGILENMPPHIRKVCLALENSNQLSSALNQYIHNEAAGKLNKIFFIGNIFFWKICDSFFGILLLHCSIAVQTRRSNITKFTSWKANWCRSCVFAIRTKALNEIIPFFLLQVTGITIQNVNFNTKARHSFFLLK